jgi:hypothetical protein
MKDPVRRRLGELRKAFSLLLHYYCCSFAEAKSQRYDFNCIQTINFQKPSKRLCAETEKASRPCEVDVCRCVRVGQRGLDGQRFSGSRWLFSRYGPTVGGSDLREQKGDSTRVKQMGVRRAEAI